MIAQVAIQCPALTDTTHVSAQITAGQYLLVVESKQGRAQGTLRLWPTSSRDRSPTHPDVIPPAGDTDRAPLYGSTDVPFHSIGLPVDSAESSRDPIYPGVIAYAPFGEFPLSLVIGSEGNRRDGQYPRDGGGIGLFVRRIGGDGFSGTWGPWGQEDYGTGHFCAFRALNRPP